jgi:hypothetical protein
MGRYWNKCVYGGNYRIYESWVIILQARSQGYVIVKFDMEIYQIYKIYQIYEIYEIF